MIQIYLKKILYLVLVVGVVLPGSSSPADVAADIDPVVVAPKLPCPETGQTGTAFVISPTAPLYQSGAANAIPTNDVLPALTRVTCFSTADNGGGRYKVLVSTSQTATSPSLCGWLNSTDLLQQPGMNLQTPCPAIAERKVRDYSTGNSKQSSPLGLKLLTWNIHADADSTAKTNPDTTDDTANDTRLTNINIPAFAYPDGSQVANVAIYNVYPVYDFKRVAGDNNDWFLIGANNKHLLGWVREQDAVIWDNRLTLYFKPDAPNANIYYRQATLVSAYRGGADAKPLARPPENLQHVLSEATTVFPKFPVLQDLTGNNPPSYNIAFIGDGCSGGADCQAVDPAVIAKQRDDLHRRLEALQHLDVLFLIDATSSMQRYFPAVARAVDNTVRDHYAQDSKVRIGVAVYGDFTSNSRTFDAPIQYEEIIPLAPFYEGQGFQTLPNQKPFFDVQQDKPEAVFEALYDAANKTTWVSQGRHVIIHIADHGPRDNNPPTALLQKLQEHKVFYIPVPVSGKYQRPFNENFVTATQNILQQHTTTKGRTMGQQHLAYDEDNNESRGVDATQRAVTEILRVELERALDINTEVVQELYDVKPATTTSNPPAKTGLAENFASLNPDIREVFGLDETTSNPPAKTGLAANFASLNPAMREVFGLDEIAVQRIQNQRQLVAPGYVGRYDATTKQDQWDYFVAVDPGFVPLLTGVFGSLCNVIGNSAATMYLNIAISNMTMAMTGDAIPNNQSLYEYLRNVLLIPLAKDTILDEPISELQAEISRTDNAPALLEFKKKVCKSALQFKLVDNLQRTAPGQDLTWDEASQAWQLPTTKAYNWKYAPESGSAFIYLPLEFFPD